MPKLENDSSMTNDEALTGTLQGNLIKYITFKVIFFNNTCNLIKKAKQDQTPILQVSQNIIGA